MSSARRQTTDQSSQANRRPREAEIVPIPNANYQSAYQRAHAAPERIGDILRRARERRGDDLHYIAEYLCIRRTFLEALEDSRYEEFPADAYVIGFLRSYAELLGFDGKEAVDLYRSEMAGRRKKPALNMPTAIPEGRSPSGFVMVGAVIAVILIYVTWYGLSSSDRATKAGPAPPPSAATTLSNHTAATVSVPSPAVTAAIPAPPAAPNTAATSPLVSPDTSAPSSATSSATAKTASQPAAGARPTENADPKANGSAPAAPDAAKPHLLIRADQSSWVLVNDAKGKPLIDKVLKPGETFSVPDGPGELLTTGNGSGITLVLDGVELPKLSSASSGTIRDIPLDGDRLKARTNNHN